MIGRRGAITAGFALAASAAQAQANWPDRPMRLIVGYPAGGPSDVFARLMAAQMGARLAAAAVQEFQEQAMLPLDPIDLPRWAESFGLPDNLEQIAAMVVVAALAIPALVAGLRGGRARSAAA